MKINEKDTKQGIVPALRFPEFLEAGGWVYLKGDKVFEQISNRKHSSNLPILAISQEHGAVPRDLIDYKVIVSDEGLENYKVVERGDFIISLRSFQGGIEYSAYNGICSPAYIILRKRLDVDNQFFKYYFKSRAFIQDLNKNLEGIRDGKMVSYKQFSEILLPIPSISNKAEQQKIADCLSSIDALIKAAKNKIDELKAHKKGLMQQLFPAEGETVPALRFPEFQNAGEWKKGPLSRIGEVLQGYGFPEKYQGKSLGKYPFYKVSDISKAVQTGCNFISEAANYIGDEELNILKIKTIPPGTTIFARIGEAIRLNRRIVTTQECIIDNNTVGVKAIPENAIDLFVYYILLQIDLVDFAGGVVPAVTKSAIENIPIYCPPTKSEQQKIADCLSSMDDLIMAQTNRLEALRNHKKGLMQQLFPNLNNHEE